MNISIRDFSDTKLEIADTLLQAAFQRPDSWIRELSIIRKLQPAGAFLAFHRETPVGIVVSLMYPDFAYVGPLGVHPDSQHQGIGFVLMERVLDWLDGQGVKQIALDASPKGQSIYERLGFVPFDRVNIFQRQSGEPNSQPPPEVQPLSLQNLDLIVATDKQVFGTDRNRLLSALLEVYSRRSLFLQDGQGNINGYLIAQEKGIGPWVSHKKTNAELLLRAALSLPFSEGPITVIVPDENYEATILLEQYGFEKVRELRHMVRGSKQPAGQRENVYGQTSPSLG